MVCLIEDDPNGAGKTKAELENKSTYKSLGWSFEKRDNVPWKIAANKKDGFLYFYWEDL
ncbi:MAG: hypothetical protein LBD84_02980 [Campylobacteraceae bacterium]|jgi:hypothetical protein|nr:hypothetical protein [Campylobacteraceae bacterium]